MTFRFTQAQQEAYLEHLRNGERRGAAADQVGLDRIDVRKYIESHPEFEELVQYAEIDANEHVLEALYQAAITGNPGAIKLWLERSDGAESRLLNKPPGRSGPPPKPDKGLEEPEPDEADVILNVTAIDPRRRRKRH